MRAAVLTAVETVEIMDAHDFDNSADDTLIDVHGVGVCGTDLNIFTGLIPVTYPRILGHEIVGTVAVAGSGPDVGTRVLVDPGRACGRCRQCREGKTNVCVRGGLLGRDVDGGLRQQLPVSPRYLHTLPDVIDDHTAPLLQVLTTCLHAHRLVGIFPGNSVVVLGLGVTGLLHVQTAKLRGANPVIAVTRSPEKLELAARFGADLLIPADGSEVEHVAQATGGADLVVECAGTTNTLARAIEMARVGGRILAYGTIAETSGMLPFYDLYYKELEIVAARASRPEDFALAIDLVARDRIQLEPLLTSHRFKLEEAAEAFRTAATPGTLKVVIDVG
jgi:L-iditol 2-dehydrogenase